MSNERLGIVAEGQRRRTVYARYINRRVMGENPGRPARMISPAIRAEIDAIVAEALDRQRREIEEIALQPLVSMRTLIDLAAFVTETTRADLCGPRRSRCLAWPRHFAMWLVKEMRPDLSLPSIGRAFNRDHTTIMHALKNVAAKRDGTPFKEWMAHPSITSVLEPQ